MKLGRFDLVKPPVPEAAPPPGPAPARPPARGLPKWFWPVCWIVTATVAAYWPVFSAGFIWDDDDFIINNVTLRDLHGLGQIWFNPEATLQYYPLVHTVFWAEFHLWGLWSTGYHVINVLLHAAGAVLLWRVLLRLALPGAWLAAAIFALHPVQTESVAWATELKNVLSAVLYFSAALCYLRFAGLGEEKGSGGIKWPRIHYAAALVLFVGALLSKTVVCSLPAALLLVHWWKQDRLQPRNIFLLAPFFAVGMGLGLLTAWLEKHVVGAQGADWALSFGDRCLIAGRALWFYASKIVWPHPLVFIYPRWTINTGIWWQWLFPLGAAAVTAGLWFARNRIGKGPLVAVLFFAGTLLPALGFIDLYPMRFSFVADHFQYLASIGMVALIVGGLAPLVQRRLADGQSLTALTVLILFPLAALTWRQCHIYKDLETLWADTLAKNPRCWMAHTNLGRLLAQQGMVLEAQGRPDAAAEMLAEAEAHYTNSLALNAAEEVTHYNYANLLAKERRWPEAEAQYRLALQLRPEVADTHNNFGFVLKQQGRTDEAIVEYQRAIFYKPDYADAYYNLGNALSAEHKMDAAIRAYRHALRLRPDSEIFQKRLQALGVPAN